MAAHQEQAREETSMMCKGNKVNNNNRSNKKARKGGMKKPSAIVSVDKDLNEQGNKNNNNENTSACNSHKRDHQMQDDRVIVDHTYM